MVKKLNLLAAMVAGFISVDVFGMHSPNAGEVLANSGETYPSDPQRLYADIAADCTVPDSLRIASVQDLIVQISPEEAVNQPERQLPSRFQRELQRRLKRLLERYFPLQ